MAFPGTSLQIALSGVQDRGGYGATDQGPDPVGARGRLAIIFIERPDPHGPFGAKGLGECAMIPTAPAILNGLADATGARITRLPATRQHVLEALGALRTLS